MNRLSCAIMMGSAALALPSPAVSQAVKPGTPVHATFIGCGGDVATLDIAADSVVESWNITRSASLEAIASTRWDGCAVEGFAYDPRRHVVFLVLPDRAREESEDSKKYRIVAASLPRLERLATYFSRDSTRPDLLFDVHDDRLLAQWNLSDSVPTDKKPGWKMTLLWLSSPTLMETRRVVQHVPSIMNDSFVFPSIRERSAYDRSAITVDGMRMINKSGITFLAGDSLTTRKHRLDLSPEDVTRITAFAGSDSIHFPWVADQGSRRVLMQILIGPQELHTTLVALRDIDGPGVHHPLIEVPQGHLTLLDDDRHFLVQESADSVIGSTMVSGRVVLYDGETGRRVRDVTDPRLAGTYETVRPICATPDQSRMYVTTNQWTLGIIRWTTGDFIALAGKLMMNSGSDRIFTN